MDYKVEVKSLMVDPITDMPVVVLENADENKVLPIWIGAFEANAIAIELEQIQTPRPMTHDLLKNILINLDGKIEKIVVNDLSDSTYFAKIYIRNHEGVSIQDSRPSDAIALALRMGAPIYVSEQVFEKSREQDLLDESEESEKLKEWLQDIDPDDLGEYKM